MSYNFVGGWEGIQKTLPPEFFSFTNLRWQDFINWGITIIPIWFVGMTLYQRIFAAKDVKSAKKAWFIAGIDRKSTRLNSSHVAISYAVFCLKKKNSRRQPPLRRPT